MSTRRWDDARAFALGLPSAEVDSPWDEVVVKVRRKPGPPPWRKDGQGVWGPMFLWLGRRDAAAPAVSVKLTAAREAAIAIAGAVPTTTSGLGQWGWVTVTLDHPQLDADLLRDWIEESYRNVAPQPFVAELDARRDG